MDISYPSWVYHKTLAPRVVENPEELAALGPGWADTPAAFAEPEKVDRPKPGKPKE